MAGKIEDTGAAGVFRFEQSDALLRKVMETAAIGMSLLGADGRLIYTNRAYETMLGYGPGQCLGIDAEAIIHDADRQLVMLRFSQLMSGEVEALRVECRMRHADSQPIWVDVAASLLRSDSTGRPLYAIVQIVNIDRQKRAEEALVYAERRWNSALEGAKQGVWDHDARTDRMFYSRMWRTMRGYAPDEEVDDSQDGWIARVHPDDRQRILDNVHKQDAGLEGHDTLEYRERHRDGHYIWILSRGKPVEWDSTGRAVRTVGTDTDITHLKQVEAQLAAEKERLRVTLESIGDGVISIDAHARITFMNPTAEQMTGWSLEEAAGHPLEQVFTIIEEGSGGIATSPVARCLAEGIVTNIDEDVCLIGRDCDRRDIRSSASPLRAEDGTVSGAVLVFQDVTSSRALQRQLAHSATHDALTGLPNRLAFERTLASVSDQARAEMRSHALCFIDLDRFKPVNDTAGHAAGDEVLRLVAGTIRACCRRHDFAARIGGDEFALILADCPLSVARRIAQRLVDAIAALDFRWEGQSFPLGASIGITAIHPRSGAPAEITGEADSACYVAKANGRGGVAFYATA